MLGRFSSALLVLTLVAGAGSASAKAAKTKAPPEPAGPPPSLEVRITPGRLGELWWLRLANTGSTPVRVLADARLLSFDVEAPGQEPVRCALPASMRPLGEGGRALVLPPQHGYEERFDPRLYCFGAKSAAALVPGARVTALYGFAPPPPKPGKQARRPAPTKAKPDKAPFVARGAEGASLTPLKHARGEAVLVPEKPAPVDPDLSPPRRGGDTAGAAAPARFRVRAPSYLDGYDDDNLYLTVTVTNEAPAMAVSRVRSSSVGLRVITPQGQLVDCQPIFDPAASPEELVTRLRPGAQLRQTVLLSARCPAQTFATPGLYAARVYLDSTHVTATPPPPSHGDGLFASEPLLVRVHHGRGAAEAPPLRAVPINP